jgi:hypothetical protein
VTLMVAVIYRNSRNGDERAIESLASLQYPVLHYNNIWNHRFGTQWVANVQSTTMAMNVQSTTPAMNVWSTTPGHECPEHNSSHECLEHNSGP